MPTHTREQRNLLEQATARYQESVGTVLPYLAERGISQETAAAYRLGYVAEPMATQERFKGRLCIPYLTRSGVVQMKFRALMPDQEPKYLGLNGELRMYNVEALFTDRPYVAITEGELDAVVLSANVGLPAVAVPGASCWRDHFPRLFEGFDKVLLLIDNDPAGRDLAGVIRRDLSNAVLVRLPPGGDVTDTYLAEGAEGLVERCGL